MDSTTLAAFLGGGGVAAIVTAVVTGLFSKRKLGAEATEIITKAASGVVERIEKDNLDLRAEVTGLKEAREQDKREWRQVTRDWRAALQLHAAWDALAIAKLHEAGIEIPEPPPLYPPRPPDEDD